MKAAFLIFLGIVFTIFSCSEPLSIPGPQGPQGTQGPQGQPGGNGFRLIAEYQGAITEKLAFIDVSIPEIYQKRSSTFVLGYWTTKTVKYIYTPLSDGWIDNVDVMHTMGVSWDSGKVYLFGMDIDDIYYIQVFGTD